MNNKITALNRSFRIRLRVLVFGGQTSETEIKNASAIASFHDFSWKGTRVCG